MLQLLLTILKILGILILVILGIILAVLLVVLLVPVRYQGDVSFDGKPKGEILVSWFLRVVKVRVSYDGASLKALVKVLWLRLFEQTLWPSEEAEEVVDELADELDDDGFFADIDAEAVESVVEDAVESTAEAVPENAVENTAEAVPVPAETRKADAEGNSLEKTPDTKSERSSQVHEESRTPEITKTASTVHSTDTEPVTEEIGTEEEKTPRMTALAEKIQSIINRLIEKVKAIYNSLSGKYQAGQEKIQMVREFLGDAANQDTIRLIWRQIVKIIKHVLPGKMSGRVKFGFDDPATTGQILTYISPFYGVYAKSVTIEPVFDEKIMEGDLQLKGRIRLGTLLWNVIRVFFNKNFRTLLKKFMKRRK